MTETDIGITFRHFEDFAELENVPVPGLSQILGKLLQKFNYQPGICELEISNVFRARALSASTIEQACGEFKDQKALGCPPDRIAGQN
ncbi:hypothetical protein [Dyadobacter alkalitolerans]|uniref:hypothetical protein n=1 Tax=Dyadobacter alkalitolerans TaxID=492736 RepID=UPI000478D38D|nr:hypothetical protein [Dyadobacter alkalitolerans]